MIERVSDFSLFHDISEDEFADLLPMFKLRQYNRNHTLIFEEDESDEVYFIRSGLVKVFRMKEDQELVFHYYLPGDVVGEVEAILGRDNPSRLASIEAVEPVSAWVIAGSDLRAIIERYPAVLRRAYALLAKCLEQMNRRLRAIAFDDVRTRSANLLLELYEHYGTVVNGVPRIHVRLPQSSLADMIGVTRESISKMLGAFKREGIIAVTDRTIHILDMPKLEQSARGLSGQAPLYRVPAPPAVNRLSGKV